MLKLPIVKDLLRFLLTDLWLLDVNEYRGWKRFGIRTARDLTISILRYRESKSDVQSAALTSITLLSLVPMLAFGFTIAKSMGYYRRLQLEVIEPAMNDWLGISDAPELSSALAQMLTFVENTDFSSLGVIGLITILYAVVRLLSAVEVSLNDLWQAKKSRPLLRKLSDYLSVMIVVPIVLLLAATASTSLSNITGEATWLSVGFKLVIFPVVWFGFSMIYRFMPNTTVQLSSALRGGILGGTLWLLIHWAHIKLQVGVANYNAIYAGFSAFPIFMVWIYFSWSAVLIGGALAAGHQVRDSYRQSVLRRNLQFRRREELALQIAVLLGIQYQEEDTKLSHERIMEVLNLEPSVLKVVLNDLESSLLICQTQTGDCVLAQPPERITIFEVTESIKGPPERPQKSEEKEMSMLSQQLEHFSEKESEDIDPSSVVGALEGLVGKPDPLLAYRGVPRFGEDVLDAFYNNIKTGPGQRSLAELVQQLKQAKPIEQVDSAEPLQMLPSGV